MLLERWRQHRQMTRKWGNWFAGRRYRASKFYSHLFHTGFHKWFILPLQACSVFNADALERHWIAKLGATLNTCDLPQSCRRYQLLLGARVADILHPEKLMPVSQRIVSQLRCTVPIPEQLQALSQARTKFSGPLRSQLYQAVDKDVRRALGITLPACVPLRIPSILADHSRPLHQTMEGFLHSFPLPLPLRQYLVSAVQVSFTRAQTVSQHDTVAELMKCHIVTCVCLSMHSVQYCSSHLSHMEIFSRSDLVQQQRAHTSPSSPTTSSSSFSSCVSVLHTCAGTCSHGPYGGWV